MTASSPDTVARPYTVADFDFHLPPELIAQHPAPERSGSIPPPLDPSLHVELIEAVAERGGATALDADGPVVTAILASHSRPTLLKINAHELERVVGRPVPDVQTALHAARELQRRGMLNVVVTLGEHGAVAVTTSGEFRALPPAVEVQSAVGAGDAFVAALSVAISRGKSLPRALELANRHAAWVASESGAMPARGARIASS